MSLGFVYTGEKRFEKIGRENHKLLYNELSEFTSFKIYDECKKDRKSDEFILSAPNQIWDFYKALPAVKERIVVKMRTDIWFSKSSIPHVINEILATLQGKRTFTLIGSELKTHYNKPGELTEARLKMAYMPKGANLINNPVSFAPGFNIKNIFVFPGVPQIMESMFLEFIDSITENRSIPQVSMGVWDTYRV